MSDTTKTAENVANRRRADDWKARQPWTDAEHDSATDAIEAHSLRLHGLSKLVELAAFAGEARRALVSLDAAFEHRPKVRDDLRAHAHLLEWAEMSDVTGEALAFIADEMRKANDALHDAAYRLANRLKENEQSEAAKAGRGPA